MTPSESFDRVVQLARLDIEEAVSAGYRVECRWYVEADGSRELHIRMEPPPPAMAFPAQEQGPAE